MREGDVETVVGKGNTLGHSAPDLDLRSANLDPADERSGRIDGRDGVCAETFHQVRGQRPGPTSNVEHMLACVRVREGGELPASASEKRPMNRA